ncbi:esterase [Kaistia sp. 32K]|uniref:RBBP9/YdeN family alpha/beta hydrolase n=1 Tax=Kaistia sp. 32K TaxID=2795690 RepID=UPI0019355FA9|nr:alpha/beta fold hydrolase [Kaistia sp. 32K]BCP54754.1 esterase [Kaistia sp. 32K]
MSRLIIPGWQGSGAGHWQRRWLDVDADARIVEQDDWHAPDLEAWLQRLDAAVRRARQPTLVAHSLGVVLVAHYAKRFPRTPITGALLVAPADVESLPGEHPLAGFGSIPLDRLPFPSILALSRNDPYVSVERGRFFASRWGSELHDMGTAGHINTESGHGKWADGFRLAARLGNGTVQAAA